MSFLNHFLQSLVVYSTPFVDFGFLARIEKLNTSMPTVLHKILVAKNFGGSVPYWWKNLVNLHSML